MAYNLAKFRELIRLTLDLDAADLPDTLVDEWIRDGSTRAQTRRQQWPFYEQDWTFTVTSGQSTYTLAAVKGSSDYDVGEIRQVRGPSRELRWQDITTRDTIRQRDMSTQGTPYHWSQWHNGDLILDPAPSSSSDTYVVRGYAKRQDWVAGGAAATSDMPEEFDSVILNWAVGRAYAQQDEPQMALYYADMADLRLRELVKYYDDPSPAHNVTWGGDYNRQISSLVDPRFSWE